jgi:hypothetical protein
VLLLTGGENQVHRREWHVSAKTYNQTLLPAPRHKTRKTRFYYKRCLYLIAQNKVETVMSENHFCCQLQIESVMQSANPPAKEETFYNLKKIKHENY